MKVNTLNNNGVINMQENHLHNYLDKRFPRKDRWDWDEMHKPVKNDKPKAIHLKSGGGRKIKLLRVLVALHEAGFFVDDAGAPVDQQDVFAAFAGILGVDLARANSNISDSLHRYNKQIRLQVFDDLKKAFSDYEDELLERQKE